MQDTKILSVADIDAYPPENLEQVIDFQSSLKYKT